MFGGPGNDVNLWAPGDGSEAFIGGPGRDALIFGATDRDDLPDPTTGVRLPTLLFGVAGFPQGIPTADVSGLPQVTARVETEPARRITITSCGSAGAAGNIIVTVRVAVSSRSSARAGGASDRVR